MSAWWLLPLALAACLAVVAVAACLSPKPRHAAPRRHLEAVPEPEGICGRPGERGGNCGLTDWADGPSFVELDAYGDYSPQRADRLAGLLRDELLDWREQTAADLSPEALDSDVQPDPYLDALAAEHGSEWEPEDAGLCAACVMDDHCDGAVSICDCTCGWPKDWAEADDSGPGGLVSSLTPGPVWLDQQLAALYEWVRAQYAAAAA